MDTHTAPTKVELVNGATPFRAEQKKRPAPISEEPEASGNLSAIVLILNTNTKN